MSILISLKKFVVLSILSTLILSGCNGSAAVIDDLEDSSGIEKEENDRSSENIGAEPTAIQAEESNEMETKDVLVEIRVPQELATDEVLLLMTTEIALPGFKLDPEYQPVPVPPSEEDVTKLESANEEVVLVRGTIRVDQEEELKKDPRVIAVWTDARIEAFDN